MLHFFIHTWKSVIVHLQIKYWYLSIVNSWTKFGQKFEIWTKFVI